MESNSIYQQMTKEPIGKLIRQLSIPAIIGSLVFSFYNIIDTFFVAKIGVKAVSAVGIVFSITALIQALGYTVGMGAASRMSKELGKKHKESAGHIAFCACVLSVGIGVIVSILGILFLPQILAIAGAKESIFHMAKVYGGFVFLSVQSYKIE